MQLSRVIFLTATGLLADTITLLNGNVVEGTFLGGTAREVRMQTGDRVDTFPVETVAGVQFGPRMIDREKPEQPAAAPVGGYDLPSGTQLTVRLIDAVDSDSARRGDTFRAKP